MEAQLMNLAIETYKITLVLSLPMLLVGLVIGLLISIFQATTQINEMTLTFVPKILAVIVVIYFYYAMDVKYAHRLYCAYF